MSDWKPYKLEELGTLQRGRSRHRPRYAFHLYGGKYPFIQTGEIREARKYIRKFEQTYSEAGLEQSQLWPKGTLCITIAANIAELAILSFDACFPDSVLGFLPDESITDLDFIYYTLTHFQRELKHIGEGSVQDNINVGTFDDILFPVPPLPEQKAIASVLSSLDDKIDLLYRQNKTLVSMSETLFRQWFVEEANENCKVGTLGDIVSVKYGKDHQKLNDGDIPAFGSGGIMRYVDRPLCLTESVLIPRKGSLGNVIYINEPFWTVDTMFFTEMKKPNVAKYVYFAVKSMDLASMNVGSAVPSMTTDVLNNLLIFIPSDDVLTLFEEVISPMFTRVENNMIQIRTLEKLRDTLLPKLMSGEVRVDY